LDPEFDAMFWPSLAILSTIVVEIHHVFFRERSLRNVLALRGFTLIELLVVVVIIGLLAGYVAPRYFAQVGKSEVQIAKAQIDAFEKALDQYRLDTRRVPTTEQGLNALVKKPPSEPNWNGPYLKKEVPLDPWGKPYAYRAPGTKGDYDLISHGKDGQPGGAGENADITNF
jgi:general secretion pathway protein G